MDYLIVTNNPKVKEEFKNVCFVEGNFEDVMIKVRNLVHKGFELVGYPLGASIRMFFSPYRSILVSQNKEQVNPFYVETIENSIISYRNIMSSRKIDIKNEQDYSMIDLDLLKSTLKKVDTNIENLS